jgi:tetratricopeptide (TPR) repeat protein
MHRSLIALFALLLVSGCVTVRPRSQQTSPGAIVLDETPVRTWGDNTCGSAALATLLNRLGDPVSEEELDRIFDKGRNGGVVSLDLIVEARRRGFDAQLLKGNPEMLERSIRRETPAVIMVRAADLPGEGRDLFHYIVIDGFDPERNLFAMQFGDGRRRWAAIDRLEEAWDGAGKALFVVAPRGRMPLLDREAVLREAVAEESRGDLDAALERYRRLVADDERDTRAWINIGNVEASRQRTGEAEAAFRRAIALDPGNGDALNNLAWLLLEAGRADEAAPFAARALAVTKNDRHLAVDTAARIELARGHCSEASGLVRTELAASEGASRQALDSLEREISARCASQ